MASEPLIQRAFRLLQHAGLLLVFCLAVGALAGLFRYGPGNFEGTQSLAVESSVGPFMAGLLGLLITRRLQYALGVATVVFLWLLWDKLSR